MRVGFGHDGGRILAGGLHSETGADARDARAAYRYLTLTKVCRDVIPPAHRISAAGYRVSATRRLDFP